jgi:nucleoside-diphosphate-sugar epimerase
VVKPPPLSLAGVRVLVTGASGFLGRWVAEALLNRGAEVGLLVRDPRRIPLELGACAAQVLTADLGRAGELDRALTQWQPAVLFQLAGYGVAKDERDPALMLRLNSDLLVEAVEAMRRLSPSPWNGLRLVQAGSALEYGALPHALDESVTPKPATVYGQTKLAGTQVVQDAVRELRFPALVARMFTVFGPGERPGRLFPTLLAAASHQGPVQLSSGEQRRDFALVWDVAQSMLDLACQPASAVLSGEPPFDHGLVNLATGQLESVRAFVTAAATAFDIAPARLQFGALAQLPEEMPHQRVPVARMTSALGAPLPGDLGEAFTRVRAWIERGGHG